MSPSSFRYIAVFMTVSKSGFMQENKSEDIYFWFSFTLCGNFLIKLKR